MHPTVYEIKRTRPEGPGFFCEDCTIYHDNLCISYVGGECPKLPYEKNSSWGSCRPNRCKKCDRHLKRWLRMQKWRRKIYEAFDYDRHRFLKFGTVGLRGDKIFPIDSEDDHIEFRERLTHAFRELRKDPLWKKCVDGGMWFFEMTERPIHHYNNWIHEWGPVGKMYEIQPTEKKVNPHLHILWFGPKKIPYEPLQELCEKHGLGRFHFSRPTDRSGNDIMPGINNALGYVMSYLKKETQVSGRNRDTFGVLR